MIYDQTCDPEGSARFQQVFLATPPGNPPPEAPGVVAWRALNTITPAKPVLHAAPAADAVVGSPVWLWFDATPDVAGPLSGKATGRGGTPTVTTTITLKSVKWTVDDGPAGGRFQSFTCNSPGTPFKAGGTPTCSHVFTASSAKMKDHAYSLTVELHWTVTAKTSDNVKVDMDGVDWPTTYKEVLRVPVNEVQVLN
ncbi:hypothetical protein ACIQBJ_07915 [Kitasatospora sp. NPDC088391]|uniref:hypothetical protein n=1 Tax=Kitasatospora sp. NPDC088391 TaxID=3364074 RepID=UPI003825890F